LLSGFLPVAPTADFDGVPATGVADADPVIVVSAQNAIIIARRQRYSGLIEVMFALNRWSVV
jgi:hypothetical protein